ncbi:hypothetical protein OIU85_017838 [Salix viminalis]|uniref:Uncharacterized protein n=1 Tax=Salix viminalis TaxID=40686 RepID=A0A9Q0NID5_SALVM|nr:hypothetical protein OIU85_017838 [Salix viminalis]
MFVEIDAAAGGWEQVKKRHRNNKHSRKKPPVAAADASAGQAAASAGPAVLAEQSKSDAVLNGLNSEVDVGLAVGIAGASAGNSVGLKTASVVGVAKVAMVDSPTVNVLVVPPPSAAVQPKLDASSSSSLPSCAPLISCATPPLLFAVCPSAASSLLARLFACLLLAFALPQFTACASSQALLLASHQP